MKAQFIDNWISAVTQKLGLKDESVSSDSNISSNGNNFKRLGTFLIAFVSLVIGMLFVRLLYHLKNRYPFIEKVYISMKKKLFFNSIGRLAL